MYSGGEKAAATAVRFGGRLGGERGEMAIRLAGQAIRSVALGVVVTAVARTAVGGLGLLVVGVPFAALLTAAIFILCLIQIGPGLVMVPVVVWMYYLAMRYGRPSCWSSQSWPEPWINSSVRS